VPLSVQIVTPERVVFSEENVDSVTVPGADGELTILPSHAPLMTLLQPGALTLRRNNDENDIALSGGFLEVRDDELVILADTAERSEEIDQQRAEEARVRAADRLSTREDTLDIARAAAALERATARLRVIERRRRRPSRPERPGSTQPPQV
jgi:F-type H+-transporting ATPase subunit epsilon